MREQLLQIYKTTEINHKDSVISAYKIKLSFNYGPRVEIIGSVKKDELYNVEFIDNSSGKVLHSCEITDEMWCSCNIKYFIDWKIRITQKSNNNQKEYKFKLQNKKVRIVNQSPSLGDCLAWTSVVDQFQKTHNCVVDYFTPYLELFNGQYNNINFLPYSDKQNNDDDYYSSYDLGYYYEQDDKRPIDCRSRGLQELACDILGLEFVESKCRLFIQEQKRPLKEKYVCISTSSTAACKHWQNETGWQQTVDYINNLGYKVVVIQKEPLDYMDLKGLKNVLHPQTKGLQDAMTWLSYCEFYIGLGSGVSWLSWNLNKPVIMISGFSKPFAEFSNPYRVINTSVCNGCWNDLDFKFNPSDWNWCPRNKNFECSKKITFDMVKEKIDNCIQFLD